MHKLTIIDDENYEVNVPIMRDEISIGRKLGNTIRLPERNISRHHAILTRENNAFFIEDLDSYNGVVLNGNKITRKTSLYEDDLIEIGEFKIWLRKTEKRPAVSVPEGTEVEVDIEADALVAQAEDQAEVTASPNDMGMEDEAQTPPASVGQAADLSDISRSETLLIDTAELDFQTPEDQPPVHHETDKIDDAGQIVEADQADETAEELVDDSADVENNDRVDADLIVELDQEPEIAGSDINSAKTILIPAMKESDFVESEASDDEESDDYDSLAEGAAALAAAEALDNDLDVVPSGGKGKWIALIVVLLVLAAGGYYLFGPSYTYMDDRTPPKVAEKEPKVVPEPAPVDAKLVDDETARGVIEKKMADKKAALTREAEQAKQRETEAETALIATAIRDGRALFEQQKWQETIDVLNEALQAGVVSDEIRQLRDQAQLEKGNKGNYQKGLKALSKNNYFQAIGLFGQISPKSFYGEKAQKNYDIARTKQLKSYTANGWKSYKQGHYTEAMNWAEKALDLDQDDKDAKQLHKASRLKVNDKQKQPKVAAAEQLDARQHYRIGTNYYNKGQYHDAINHFKQAIKLESSYAYAFRGLGVCYAKLNQTDKAMLAYRRYIALKPNASDAAQVREILAAYESQTKNKK